MPDIENLDIIKETKEYDFRKLYSYFHESNWNLVDGALSFDDAENFDYKYEIVDGIQTLASVLVGISLNILFAESVPVEEKEAQILSQIREFANRISMVMDTSNKEKATSFLDTIKGFFSKLSGEKKVEDKLDKEGEKDKNKFMVWKDEETGLYRWFSVYSNNYRDREGDIISGESHKNFVKAVDDGLLDYPVLLHWHVKGTDWGKADWLHYDEETGFALASGYVYEGHEKEAELLSLRENIGNSHGMPRVLLQRDEKDSSVIKSHVTIEISDLPIENAANQLTGFQILKEEKEMIPENKKDFLRSVGINDEQIDHIESSLKDISDEAKETLDHKEEGTDDVTEVTEPVEKLEDVADGESDAKDVEDVPEDLELKSNLTTDDLKQIMQPFTDAIKAISDKVDALETGMKDNAEKALSPAAAIAAMFAKDLSASESEDTVVDKRTKLSKEGPTQVDDETNNIVNPDSPLGSIINGLISNKS